MHSDTTLKIWTLAQHPNIRTLSWAFRSGGKWPCCWCQRWLLVCQGLGSWESGLPATWASWKLCLPDPGWWDAGGKKGALGVAGQQACLGQCHGSREHPCCWLFLKQGLKHPEQCLDRAKVTWCQRLPDLAKFLPGTLVYECVQVKRRWVVCWKCGNSSCIPPWCSRAGNWSQIPRSSYAYAWKVGPGLHLHLHCWSSITSSSNLQISHVFHGKSLIQDPCAGTWTEV